MSSSPSFTASESESSADKFHFNSYNGRAGPPPFLNQNRPNTQESQSSSTSGYARDKEEASDNSYTARLEDQVTKPYVFPSSSPVSYSSLERPDEGSLQMSSSPQQQQHLRNQQVISQQSVVTMSTNSPRRSRKYSGQSFGSSEYSRSTSPLDYKPPANEMHSRKTSIASLRHSHFVSVGSPQSGRDSAASSTSSHLSQSQDGMHHAFSMTSTPAVKPRDNSQLRLSDSLSSNNRMIADKIPTDTTERIISPELREIPNSSSDNIDNNHSSDSLRSANSELGELEEFNPKNDVRGQSMFCHTDSDDEHDSLLQDETQVLMEKAASYKQLSETMPSDDMSVMGVRKEKSVIDSLQQENFQLKLKIVLMENQLKNSSSSGVAELQKRIVESEAARIAMKNEIEKLRQTMASLEEENEEKEQVKSSIETLQLEIAACEQEREEFDQERALFHDRETELKVSAHRKSDSKLIFRITLKKRSETCMSIAKNCLPVWKRRRRGMRIFWIA